MRAARAGKERWVVRLMNQGRQDDAIAYMKANGMIQAFAGAPEWKPVSVPVGQGQVKAEVEAYKYPDFKPIRDPLPDGVKWARIKRELGHQLQKVAVWEDNDQVQLLLWMTLREQAMAIKRKGRLIGQVFPVEVNPDDRQGGYRVWRKEAPVLTYQKVSDKASPGAESLQNL